jgi:TRAP-type C4-dicarboxylate transport system substrate-binding protein
VQTGQAQVGEVLISIHENEDPLYGLDVVPFLATSYEQAKKLYEAQRPAFEKKLGAQGLMLLFAVPWGPQGIYAKKDLNTVDDMKGMRWRAYNAGTARIAELTGMQSVTIQAAELPQALATGVVNSFMSSGSTGYDSKALGDADPFLRHPGLAAEERHLREQGRLRRARQAGPGGHVQGRQDRGERGWKVSQEKTQW